MRLFVGLAVCFLLIGAGHFAAGAPPVFTNRSNLPWNPPFLAQSADLTGDGVEELFTGSSVYAVSTNGCLSNLFSFGTNARAMAVADMDGDGRVDLLRDRQAWRGAGDGTFEFVTSYFSGVNDAWPVLSVAVGDFNGDGKWDACHMFPSDVEVWTNAGNGVLHLAAPTFITHGFGNLSAADFNGDGITDIALADNMASSHVRLCLGTSAGVFAAPLFYQASSGAYDFLVLATSDVNTDGFADLIVGALFDTNVAVFLGTNDGVAGPRYFPNDRMMYSTPDEPPLSLHMEDWNGDGHEDVMTYFGGNTRAWFLAGRGDGDFEAGQPVLLSTNVHASGYHGLMPIDLNRDGRMDIIRPYDDETNTVRYAFLANATAGTTNAPAIEITTAGSSHVVSWLREGFGFFRLQSATNIVAGDAWKNVTGAREAGARNYVTNGNEGTLRMYRLRQAL